MSQPNIDQAFQIALRHHRAGQLAEAQKLYKQILDRQPTHAGALHQFGAIALRQGRNDVAVELIRQALSHDPTLADAHNSLGIALAGMGLFDDALAALPAEHRARFRTQRLGREHLEVNRENTAAQ